MSVYRKEAYQYTQQLVLHLITEGWAVVCVCVCVPVGDYGGSGGGFHVSSLLSDNINMLTHWKVTGVAFRDLVFLWLFGL